MNAIKYILLMFLLPCLSISCQEEEVAGYSDTDRINFVGLGEDDEYDPEYMFLEQNFLAVAGDTCKFPLKVKVQGKISNADRRVYFKVSDSTAVGVSMHIGECIIPAGKGEGICMIDIIRPKDEQDYISRLSFDYERSDFQRGTYERQEFLIHVYDKISVDIIGIDAEFWNNNWMYGNLGDFSMTKAAFICRTIGTTDLLSWFYSDSWDSSWGTCNDDQLLEDALAAYKANPLNKPLYDETKLPEKEWISFDGPWDE